VRCRLFPVVCDLSVQAQQISRDDGKNPGETKMSKMNTEKKTVSRKLVLNREVLRTLSEQALAEVAGGFRGVTRSCLSIC
jgi:hypothetical protein